MPDEHRWLPALLQRRVAWKRRGDSVARRSWTTYAVIWPVVCAMLFGASVTSGLADGRVVAISIGALLSLPVGLFLGGIAIAAGHGALVMIYRGIVRDTTVGQVLIFALTTAVAVTAVGTLPFLMGGSSGAVGAAAPLSVLFAIAVVGASFYAPIALRGDAPQR